MGLVWLLLGTLARGAPVVFVPLRALRPPPERPEAPPRDWIADRLLIEVAPGEETSLDLRWTLRPLRPGPLDLPLLDSAVAVRAVTVDGRPATLAQGADGWLHLDLQLDRPREVRVLASAATPAAGLDLRLAGATRRLVQVRGPWETSEEGAVRSGSRLDGGTPDRLRLSWKPAGPKPPQGTLLRAEEATALRLDATGVEATAILRYRVIHGSVDSLGFQLPVGAEALDVQGDGVLGVEREGETTRVRLARPVSDKIDLHINYHAPPLASAASTLPIPWAQAAATQGWATLLRGDEGQFVPSPGAGAEAVSARDLPDWAQGLSEGDPIASYRLSGEGPSLSARVVHWEPIEGPPTVIDEARYEVATVAHGRQLLRVRYQVRNDRRQFLRLDVPDQLQLISASVAGHAVQAARDEQGHLLIPLEKSVETMQGLVTFPVDIAFWGSNDAWGRRGRRELRTPTVDAPIAYARWELVLPPGYDGRPRSGNATPVADWSSRDQGMSYGHSYGDALTEDPLAEPVTGTFSQNFNYDAIEQLGRGEGGDPADDGQRAQSEEISQSLWNQAYDAYKRNDYSGASTLLDQSLTYNANNQAAVALRANVEVLLDTSGTQTGGEDEANARRVRDLARAKTGEAEVQQQALRQEADEAVRSGDYSKAEEKLAKLEQVSGVLAGVEQSESVEKKNAYKQVQAQLSSVRRQLGKEAPAPVNEPVATPEPMAGGASNENTYLLDGVKVSDDRAQATRTTAREKRQEPIAPQPETVEVTPEEAPLRPGYATVLLADEEAARQLREHLVVDPDLADLLTGEDLSWDGEEDLRTEVVYGGRERLTKDFLQRVPSGRSYQDVVTMTSGVMVGAVSQSVPIPRGGRILRFEARLLAEGQPLSVDLAYRSRR